MFAMIWTFLKHSNFSGIFSLLFCHLREEDSTLKRPFFSSLRMTENEGTLVFSAAQYSIITLKMEEKFLAKTQRNGYGIIHIFALFYEEICG